MYDKMSIPKDMLLGIESSLAELLKRIAHSNYIVGHNAYEKARDIYNFLVIQSERDGLFPGAYIRRIIWTLHVYALLYHIFLGYGEEQEIRPEAYEWAGRLLPEFNRSVSWVLKEAIDTDSVKMLQRAENLIKTRRERGATTNARDLVNALRVGSKDAETLMRLAKMAHENPVTTAADVQPYGQAV
jgi:hypothetical protein